MGYISGVVKTLLRLPDTTPLTGVRGSSVGKAMEILDRLSHSGEVSYRQRFKETQLFVFHTFLQFLQL